jgi:hypothetical protein
MSVGGTAAIVRPIDPVVKRIREGYLPIYEFRNAGRELLTRLALLPAALEKGADLTIERILGHRQRNHYT